MKFEKNYDPLIQVPTIFQFYIIKPTHSHLQSLLSIACLYLPSQPPTHPPSPLSAVSTHPASQISISALDSISQAVSEATTTLQSSWVWQLTNRWLMSTVLKKALLTHLPFPPTTPSSDSTTTWRWTSRVVQIQWIVTFNTKKCLNCQHNMSLDIWWLADLQHGNGCEANQQPSHWHQPFLPSWVQHWCLQNLQSSLLNNCEQKLKPQHSWCSSSQYETLLWSQNTLNQECVSHIVNLVATAGVAIFVSWLPPPPINALDPAIPQVPSNSQLTYSESPPYAAPNSILTRIQSFDKKVKNSSWLKQALDQAITSSPLISCKVGLVHKVSTFWSSNQHSLEPFFELKRVIKYHCGGYPSLTAFILSEDERTLVISLVKFIAPLSTVIKDIEVSKYLNVLSVMPDSQWIVEQLKTVWKIHHFHSSSFYRTLWTCSHRSILSLHIGLERIQVPRF